MGELKIQHYVPVLNLNSFTNTDSKLFVYDKANEKVFETKVANSYSPIESEFANFLTDFINRIASCEKFRISDEEKETISTFLSLQIDRTAEFQKRLKKVSHSFNDKIAVRRIRHEHLLKMGFDLHNLDPDEIHLDYLAKGENKREGFSEIIKKYIWFIVANNTDIPFYTSDNPIVLKENVFNDFNSTGECATKGNEIIYPLTSKYLLVFRDIEILKDCESLENNMLRCSKYECIRYYNSLEFMSSFRQVYSSDKDFKIIADLKNRYPV